MHLGVIYKWKIRGGKIPKELYIYDRYVGRKYQMYQSFISPPNPTPCLICYCVCV